MASRKGAKRHGEGLTDDFEKRWGRAHEIATKIEDLTRENRQLNQDERRAIDRLGRYLSLAAAGLVDLAAYPVILSAAGAVVGEEISRVRVLHEVRDALKAARNYAGDPMAPASPAGWLMARLKSMKLKHRPGTSIDRRELAARLRAPGRSSAVGVTAWISAQLGLFFDVADPHELLEHRSLRKIAGKYDQAARAVKARSLRRQVPVSD